MHQALYRTYRPSTFSQVVGQDHVTAVLRCEVKEHRTSHAYLFCGSRGTGKTTCAKILAKAINCLDPHDGNPCGVCENCRAIDEGAASDILEMDAASNTGVDYIRDIKDAVMYAPTMLQSRVYIIDEVHMLSPGAFNALLKTLEEPPAGVVFILATTEMQKIPATILSRCQCFEFRRIAVSVIADRLKYIAQQEHITLEDDAAHLIARSARGGMRDAISLLETCSAHGGSVTLARVEELSGGISRKMIEQTVRAIADRDAQTILNLIARFYEASGDFSVYLADLIEFYRDMTVSKAVKEMPREELRVSILDLTEGEFEKMTALCALFRYETLLYHISVLDDALTKIAGKIGMSGRVAVETALLRMTIDRLDTSPEALAARIAKLEDAMLFGGLNGQDKAKGEGASVEENTGIVKESAPVTARAKSAQAPEASSAAPRPESAGKEIAGGESAADGQANAVQTSAARQTEDVGKEIDIVDAVHAYSKTDPAGASFLSNARAKLCGRQVTVSVPNAFALHKLQAGNADAMLERILMAQNGEKVSVRFALETEETAPVDALNDFD